MIRPSLDQQARWPDLMAAAQGGDRAAYTRLLTEISPYLRAAIGARLGDTWRVERALHDALLAVHRLRHTYDPRRPIAPWLHAIADAQARRARARTKRRAWFSLPNLGFAWVRSPELGEPGLSG
jgi:RNA polymerase sigma-70 factor (ECF subfamily)